jgi:putative hydrolase of the HAD superfamily
MPNRTYAALFSDIGGVLGTNGWDTDLRLKISNYFGCDHDEIQARHRLMFDSYERGFMTFEEYIRSVFCARSQKISWQDIRDYAFAESTPWPENIELLRTVKQQNNLKLALISNEGEGLTEHRYRKFGLRDLADFAVFSHFVHLRKPDREIWRLALHLAQADVSESIYIDDRRMFVDIAGELGFTAIHHRSVNETRQALQALGLATGD